MGSGDIARQELLLQEQPGDRQETPHDDDQEIVHRKSWGSRVLAALIVVVLLSFIPSVFSNKAFQWDVVAQYMFSEPILRGLRTTLMLTVVCMVLACVVGTIVALMRLSDNGLLRGLSWTYNWIFRATPLLVQLLFWFNLGALYPKLAITIPFGPTLVSAPTNQVMTATVASILGLALHEAANMAEIIRSGVLSVGRGQIDACASLGLSPFQTFWKVVLPQALRVIVPPTGSQVLSMLKMTTLVSVLAMGDLLFAAQAIYSRTFEPIPLLTVAVLWYLVLTSALMIAQHHLEQRLARSDAWRGPARG